MQNSPKNLLGKKLLGNFNGGQQRSNQQRDHRKVEKVIASEIEEYLSGIYPSLEIDTNGLNQSNALGPNNEAVFAQIFSRYVRMQNSGDKYLQTLRQDHPLLMAQCEQLSYILEVCDKLQSPVSGVLRKLCYLMLPFLNSPKASQIYGYKDNLPCVGLLMQINPAPRQFLIDALEGLCQVEEIDSEQLMALVWKERSYDYWQELRTKVEEAVAELPAKFTASFPSRDWLIEQVSYHARSQIALRKLVAEGRWDLLIVGAMEAPLALALLDVPPEQKLPVLFFSHGQPFGDPVPDLFLKADYVLTRGKADQKYFVDLGLPEAAMIPVGSPVEEAFPSQEIIATRRKETRLQCGVDVNTPVIIYGLTYDIPGFTTCTPEHLANLMLESFRLLAASNVMAKPVLYLKYHPAPVADPYFSFSRRDYPLEQFLELCQHGFTVRLVTDLKHCLPAGDCFITHESTILTEVLQAGITTLSLNVQQSKSKPLLGWGSYEEPSAHKFLNVHSSKEEISKTILNLLQLPKEFVYENCKRSWEHVFACGRTEGLAKVGKCVTSLLSRKYT